MARPQRLRCLVKLNTPPNQIPGYTPEVCLSPLYSHLWDLVKGDSVILSEYVDDPYIAKTRVNGLPSVELLK